MRRLGVCEEKGSGIDKVGSVTWPLMLKGLLTWRDPKFYLSFTSTPNGNRAASQYLQRLKERKKNRDKGPTPSAFLRQLKAITAWGKQAPQNLGRLWMPTLIVNGFRDIVTPPHQAEFFHGELRRRGVDSTLLLVPGAGHSGPELSEAMVPAMIEFFGRHLK